MKNLFRNHYLIAFFATLIISVTLLCVSFTLPPEGEISPSVLKATAELMFYPALAFAAKALADGKTAKIKHGQTSVSIGNEEDNEILPPEEYNEPEEEQDYIRKDIV